MSRDIAEPRPALPIKRLAGISLAACRYADTAHLARQWGDFLTDAWPFGAPYPWTYYDVRAERPGGRSRRGSDDQPGFVSLHAKCVVVDGQRSFISSANFTEQAQERNIECGVLLDDPHFAEIVGGQWMRLIEAGHVKRFDR